MAAVLSRLENSRSGGAPVRNPASEAGVRLRVSDGTRTRDRLDHNQDPGGKAAPIWLCRTESARLDQCSLAQIGTTIGTTGPAPSPKGAAGGGELLLSRECAWA